MRQLRAAQAFARTAHAAQGQTLDVAIVDVEGCHMESYVASTRAKRRWDMLIYTAFSLDAFARGSPKGPGLLLQLLPGDPVDWATIEAYIC